MTERCKCGALATEACNDCETGICEQCTSPDFRCEPCHSANGDAEACALFDDPEADEYDEDDEDARYIREQQGLCVSDDDIAALPSLRALV